MKKRLAALRARFPWVDHAVVMQEHYGHVKAGQQAGGVTYFAFLSFFPILALSFFVVGLVSGIYPQASGNLRTAIESLLPTIVGDEEGQLSLDDIRGFSGLAGALGLLGVLYSGLAWISALRDALLTVFETPDQARPSFVGGKLRDLLTLAVIGLILILSVAVAGFVSGFSGAILGYFGANEDLDWVIELSALVLGLGANSVLFFSIFRLLADPDLPRPSMWQGALLGAVGFEVLKQISRFLLASTKEQPAFQAFGIALVLVVWINYFSRLMLYAATWAYTTAEARAERAARVPAAAPVQGPVTPPITATGGPGSAGHGRPWVAPFAAGGASALALVAAVRRRGGPT